MNAAVPAWAAVSETIAAQEYVTHRNDLRSQVNADAPFVEALEAIAFPPEAAQQGADFIAAVRAYDEFLKTAYTDNGYLAAHLEDDERLNETRAQSSSQPAGRPGAARLDAAASTAPEFRTRPHVTSRAVGPTSHNEPCPCCCSSTTRRAPASWSCSR